MKIDLVGPRRRGLALGLNESAGYGGVALAAAATGWLAAGFVPRTVLVVSAAAIAVIGLVLSLAFARDTAAHVAAEQSEHYRGDESPPRFRKSFAEVTLRKPALRSCSQAGLVNNLNDALAWGLVPLFLAAHRASPGEIGLIAGLYPAVWAAFQIPAGHLSDRVGRKPLIVGGMLLQAAGLALLSVSGGELALAAAVAVTVGVGTACVYPTLLAAISDAVSPIARAAVTGIYRFWRDMGYAVGALIAGTIADVLGYSGAIAVVAFLTAVSGLWVLADMPIRPSPRNANA
jgi:MFS family permease